MPDTRFSNARTVRAPRGDKLNAKSWQTEAPPQPHFNTQRSEATISR